MYEGSLGSDLLDSEAARMQDTCPDCGLHGSFSFIPEAGQQVCSSCGTISHDLQVYEPTTFHDLAYALGATPDSRSFSSAQPAPVGRAGRYFWSNNVEESRRLNQLQRKPEVDARVQGTLSTLGYPGLFEQVDFLFQRARDESWKRSKPEDQHRIGIALGGDSEEGSAAASSSSLIPSGLIDRRVRWGSDSLLLATACCYAVLRREKVHIDVETVATAAHLPVPKVRRAFKLLKLLVGHAIRDIRLANPDPYLHRIVAFFSFLSQSSSNTSAKVARFLQPLRSRDAGESKPVKADSSRVPRKVLLEGIEATALDLCSFWWPQRTSSAQVPPQLAAFAIVVLAIEAHVKAPAPILGIFRYTHRAIEFDTTALHCNVGAGARLTNEDPLSKNAVEYYKEICVALKLQASKIPWLTSLTPINPIIKKKKRALQTTSAEDNLSGMSELARRDFIVHALDILDVWRSVSHVSSDCGLPPATQPARGDQGSSDPKSPLADGKADQTSPQGHASPAESSKVEVSDNELDCFDSLSGDEPLSGPRQGSYLEDASDSEDGEGAEMWPRIEARLKASGALDQSMERQEGGLTDRPHPIDLLSDEQVDQLLFNVNELNSIFRTDPAELAAFERVKVAAGDWPSKSEHRRNADFEALARRVVGDATPTQHSKRGDSATPSNTDAHKRRKRSLQVPQSTQKQSRARTTETIPLTQRPQSTVSLSAQQEESDWSD